MMSGRYNPFWHFDLPSLSDILHGIGWKLESRTSTIDQVFLIRMKTIEAGV
jgi:hypothetical protein